MCVGSEELLDLERRDNLGRKANRTGYWKAERARDAEELQRGRSSAGWEVIVWKLL